MDNVKAVIQHPVYGKLTVGMVALAIVAYMAYKRYS
jgi:hypothetical protein